VFKPFRADETAVGEETVIAKSDPKRAEDVTTRHSENDASPAEKPRQEGKQRNDVVANHGASIDPGNPPRID